MKHSLTPFTLALTCVSLLSACNLPAASSGPSLDEQAGTVVALTLSAQSAIIQTPSPARTQTLSLTDTTTPTTTPTYSMPMLTVNESTNCRSGPGQAFEILTVFTPGTSVEIVGHFPAENYWIVKNPNGGTCWIWGAYSTASGSHWTVPSMTPPSTPTGVPPQAPSIQKWDFFCSNNQAKVTILWTDKSENETGYRVYRNGEKIADLPVNTTSFVETIALLSGQSVGYNIEAYNPQGTARSSVITITCP